MRRPRREGHVAVCYFSPRHFRFHDLAVVGVRTRRQGFGTRKARGGHITAIYGQRPSAAGRALVTGAASDSRRSHKSLRIACRCHWNSPRPGRPQSPLLFLGTDGQSGGGWRPLRRLPTTKRQSDTTHITIRESSVEIMTAVGSVEAVEFGLFRFSALGGRNETARRHSCPAAFRGFFDSRRRRGGNCSDGNKPPNKSAAMGPVLPRHSKRTIPTWSRKQQKARFRICRWLNMTSCFIFDQ